MKVPFFGIINVKMYIYRESLNKIKKLLWRDKKAGVILSGIVGCGKTTLIEKLLEESSELFDVFSYSGDDIQFRQSVLNDSNYIWNNVRLKAKKRVLIFVDEVQKSEDIFDALKIAFDRGNCSFIVSGSNPAYLSTVAKKRLQRRADQFLLLPLSLFEICVENKITHSENIFEDILWKCDSIDKLQVPEIQFPSQLKDTFDQFFKYGGLPLAFLSDAEEEKLREIKLTVERGFDLMIKDNNSIVESVRIELALLNSQEFAYKNILNKTRIRKRDIINATIDDLMNHGYLFKKTPLLMYPGKSSYLSVFSYVDPGIVTYLSVNDEIQKGFQLEGYIHSRLFYFIYNSVYKASVHYYKPHTLDINNNIKYQKGEIDFIFKSGKKIVPIEVKSTQQIKNINTEIFEKFIQENKIPFGIIIYEGVPYCDFSKRILFWPYWLI